MTFAGADGETHTEMARVLHFPKDGDAIHASFASLKRSLDEMVKKTLKIAEGSKTTGGPSEPITLAIAKSAICPNRLQFPRVVPRPYRKILRRTL